MADTGLAARCGGNGLVEALVPVWYREPHRAAGRRSAVVMAVMPAVSTTPAVIAVVARVAVVVVAVGAIISTPVVVVAPAVAVGVGAVVGVVPAPAAVIVVAVAPAPAGLVVRTWVIVEGDAPSASTAGRRIAGRAGAGRNGQREDEKDDSDQEPPTRHLCRLLRDVCRPLCPKDRDDLECASVNQICPKCSAIWDLSQ